MTAKYYGIGAKTGAGAAKYNNRTVTFDGMKFDSLKEYSRYTELKLLERAGKIKELRRQVPYELIPAQREADVIGKRGGVKKGALIERAVTYIADFVYYDCESGKEIVEDTKGMRTKEYIIKRKLMLHIHGIRIREI